MKIIRNISMTFYMFDFLKKVVKIYFILCKIFILIIYLI